MGAWFYSNVVLHGFTAMQWSLGGRIISLALLIWVVTILRTLAYIYCSLFKFGVSIIKKY